jgi:Zn-dependent peptidase ImmA (M78 family)
MRKDERMRNNVIIGGQDFQIIIKEVEDKFENKYDGRIYYDEQKIIIAKRQKEYTEEIVSHEIIHGFIEKTGMSEFFKQKDIDYEYITCALTNIFWQFLKDNTDFFNKQVIINRWYGEPENKPTECIQE